jgi:hypothetical protein
MISHEYPLHRLALSEIRRFPMNKISTYFVLFAAAILVSSLPAFATSIGGGGTSVPEPAMMALLATGIGAVGVVRRFLSK